MQQKWSDRPPSEDAIDVLLNTSPAFLRAHGALLAKALPPVSGFGIFLLYFYRNHFYPSFDLFQFSSLLLAAACIGFAIVGAVIVMMVLPGAALFHWFLNTKRVKEEIVYAMLYAEDARTKAVWQLVLLAYFAPFGVVGLGLVAALVLEPSLFTITALLWSVFVALGFGIVLQIRFDLPRWSFLNYTWAAFIPLLIFVILLSTILRSSIPIVENLRLLALPDSLGGSRHHCHHGIDLFDGTFRGLECRCALWPVLWFACSWLQRPAHYGPGKGCQSPRARRLRGGNGHARSGVLQCRPQRTRHRRGLHIAQCACGRSASRSYCDLHSISRARSRFRRCLSGRWFKSSVQIISYRHRITSGTSASENVFTYALKHRGTRQPSAPPLRYLQSPLPQQDHASAISAVAPPRL